MSRRKSAFTLLELLTVISILGLLIAIIVPSLSAARRSAKANTCLTHLKSMGSSFVIYLNENEEKFPPFQLVSPAPRLDEPYVNDFHRRAPRWQWFIQAKSDPPIDPGPFRVEIQQGGYFDDDSYPRIAGASDGMTLTNDLFVCPSLDDEEFARNIRDGAYGYNYQYLGNTRDDAIPGRWDNFPVSMHRVRNLGSTLLVADSRGVGPKHGRNAFMLDPPRLATEQNARRFGPAVAPSSSDSNGESTITAEATYIYSPAEPRHNNQANAVFGDTHAEALTLSELGYQVGADAHVEGLPKGTPIPVGEPEQGTYRATNRLFNGQGSDPIAAQHQPASDGG